jgi:dephospho-CoA kinase
VSDRPFLIGLTGPIGCGKSTVGRMLAGLGGYLIDADEVARTVTDQDARTLSAIRARFGDGVFRGDGSLDRSALARVVFSDESALRDLESFVHPEVRRRVRERLVSPAATDAPFVALEAIKLVEGGLAAECDEVWLVECPAEAQRARLTARGLASDDIDRRLAAQTDIVERLAPVATRRIDNSGSVDDTRERVENALADALAPVLHAFPISDAIQRGD